LLGTISALCLSKELETNERAAIKSPEITKLEYEHRAKLIAQGKAQNQWQNNSKPSFCAYFCMKLRIAWQGFKHPVFRNFTLFLIFLGLTMPSFSSFDFYFHIDIQ